MNETEAALLGRALFRQATSSSDDLDDTSNDAAIAAALAQPPPPALAAAPPDTAADDPDEPSRTGKQIAEELNHALDAVGVVDRRLMKEARSYVIAVRRREPAGGYKQMKFIYYSSTERKKEKGRRGYWAGKRFGGPDGCGSRAGEVRR